MALRYITISKSLLTQQSPKLKARVTPTCFRQSLLLISLGIINKACITDASPHKIIGMSSIIFRLVAMP